ncbi:DUF6164 family protein [Alkalilimnicola ehrlichii MLHE-1]|uniref:DUF2007 domain-containing protein n=1 Tax=Alkalilimnicola ehrlichii (strain ATCC BAA-1101 / DSM 17681 / MLHE-1) TaxID=187272 RepID=Q0A5N9_ALKEH|nr:DUF6164 family protein [Alkalilimnicola ehrlichii]ABI57848.1 conserved hypothetical protein [Alkalilimnicola ehrlichii MLHE-1]
MAKRLMNLRNVPTDEADEVRDLLTREGIDFYETPPNRWGLSAGGIWLRDETQYTEARRLLDDYQRERQRRAREAYEQQRRDGTAETVTSLFLRNPLKVILYLGIVGTILYFSIRPFFSLGAG